MAITNVILLSQIAGYVIGLILSLCIVIPMSMHENEFRGHCLLFSAGDWQEDDGSLLVNWASRGNCHYVVAVGIIMFFMCCVQIYRLAVCLYKGSSNSFFATFLEAVACVCVCALAVSGALLVTLGFMTWCGSITQRFPSCDVAAGKDIDHKDNISTEGFYMEIGTVQFATWAAFALWVGLAVISTLQLVRDHQLENIRVSMYVERRRLVLDAGGEAAGGEAAGGEAAGGEAAGTSTPPALAEGW